ncbi:MAG: hypothetical protein H6661_09920 [Ardenticatenaceae bacterium]|nr:hypothetical protein [Ardenticatenaceae bacterium]
MSNVEDELKTEKRKRGCRNYTIAAVGGVIVVCLFMYAAAKTAPSGNVPQLAASTTEPVSDTDAPAEEDSADSVVAVSDETAVPSEVLEPAETPKPTATPAPTATPNLAPPISVFLDNYEKMTDAQWEKFSDEVSGSYIDQWEGKINQVDAGEIFGGYDMYIDVIDEEFGSEVFIGDIPEELALAFNKNQPVLFSGVVKFASNSFGMSIYLDKDTVVIEPIDNDATR